EKSTGKPFIYFNKVIKFRDIAMRGAWTSGGIEFNFGTIGHAPTTATPVDYLIKQNNDGSVSCWLGAMDLTSRTHWEVEVRVPKNKAWFETHAFWYNPTDLSTSEYHWMNASADVTDGLTYYWPGNHYIGHGGDVHPWPLLKDGRNISNYAENNFGASHSYHVIGIYTDYFGGYYHDLDYGFGHLTDYAEKPGKKIWIWALSREGAIWKDLLTDPGNRQYTEIQTGILFNQAASGSTRTPFKHLEFKSMNTERFTEYWFPVLHTGGISNITRQGIVNIEPDRLRFCPLEAIRDTLTIQFASGEKKLRIPVDLQPLELFECKIPGHHFAGEASNRQSAPSIVLGNQLLYDPGDREARKTGRPLTMPEFDWNSFEGKYYQALENSRQRNYEAACQGFSDCLHQQPNDLGSLKGLAEEYIRITKYDQALKLLTRALAIDTYDPQSNYLFGICWKQKGLWGTTEKTAALINPVQNISPGIKQSVRNCMYRAKESFGIAIRSMEYRSAAYTQLAGISLFEKHYQDALRYARSALDYNRYQIPAIQIEKIALHLLGQDDTLRQQAAVAAYLYVAPDEQAEPKLRPFSINNEFPAQTYLEKAIRYYSYGLPAEAGAILKSAPDDPIIDIWKWKKVREEPRLFPYRPETLKVLEWHESIQPDWHNRYYMGLIHWNFGDRAKAMKLLRSCGNKPQDYAFYLARARLFQQTDTVLVVHDLSRAMKLHPESWRVYRDFIWFYFDHKQYDKALEIARTAGKRFHNQAIIQFILAKAELYAHHYDKCIDRLSGLEILPNEGAREGHEIYREAHLLAAIEQIKMKHFEQAMQHIELARDWPENLGVGKPYQTDERIEEYLAGICNLFRDKELKTKNTNNHK
ncbi:MAG: DUF5107 domain-containing protein, partial [Bacteroidales bacterium]|nr:DUF5107 domain-containing protein [Bacteroidales bacterium]